MPERTNFSSLGAACIKQIVPFPSITSQPTEGEECQMLEQALVKYGSPTLARLKTANLFNFSFFSPRELQNELIQCNQALLRKGVRILVLRRHAHSALLYLYRPEQLSRDLRRRGVPAFMRSLGYPSSDPDVALAVLRRRIRSGGAFPHEIGLFLGYPLEDVAGFIKNHGANCRYAGCWKVYGNEEAARELFSEYKKCQSLYNSLFRQGKTLEQLTVPGGNTVPLGKGE